VGSRARYGWSSIMLYFYFCMVMFTFGMNVNKVNSFKELLLAFAGALLWPIGSIIVIFEALKK